MDDLVADTNDISMEYKYYWDSFILYQKALFFKSINKNEKSSEAIDKAIEKIEDHLLSSEDYVYLL